MKEKWLLCIALFLVALNLHVFSQRESMLIVEKYLASRVVINTVLGLS